MSTKQHRDFVILVRGGEEINALVAVSHDVFTPATQTQPAETVEHLTLVYLEPSAAGRGSMTGEGLRNSIRVQIDVPPLYKGQHFGWREIDAEAEAAAELVSEPKPEVPGSDGYTHGWDKGFAGENDPYGILEYLAQSANPDAASAPVAAPNPHISGPDGLTDEQRGYQWGSPEHVASLTKGDAVLAEEAAAIPAEDIVQPDPEVVAAAQPSAEDLDAHAAERTIAEATAE